MCETKAVFVRNVWFSYFNCEPILKGINLRIERASIYGLLGPSGCGKTTLLKCILGRLKPKSGDIQIFGSKPDTPECHIPGAGVGYMPQELGLCFEFTVKEILTYFGKIYAMNESEIKEKYEELIKLLQLPKDNKFIGKLSGGQQRRVSLACALIHSPPLLILDEPTVGTDPMLRHNIWSHLTSLFKSGHTIIVTTHYIEEARNAQNVAFMRNGKILDEEDPEVLLERYQSTNLEDVFLHLCYLEENDINKGKVISINTQNGSNCSGSETNHYPKPKSEKVANNSIRCISVILLNDNNNNPIFSSQFNEVSKNAVSIRNSRFIDRSSALFNKNFKKITRKWGHLFFELIFTSFLFILMIVTIGDGPTNMSLAIFDEEHQNNVNTRWGQLFVENIQRERFNFNYFDSFEKALNSVKMGENHALIDINERFTKALHLRLLYLSLTDEQTLEESQIRVHIDRSNQLIGQQIEILLYEAMVNFTQNVANKFNISSESFKLPLYFEQPIYGTKKEAFREFVIPGTFIAMPFFTAATITAHLILEEKRDGLLERSLSAGITAIEILISILLLQFVLLCFQISFLLIVSYILFNIQITGSLTLCISLIMSQGFCGVSLGLVVSILTPEIIICTLTLLCLFVATLTSSGVLWPIENMPFILQLITKPMPNTLSIQSMRDIIYRNWSIDYFEVYLGFVVTYAWFIIFVLISLIFLKRSL